jgi:hypothetical protein
VALRSSLVSGLDPQPVPPDVRLSSIQARRPRLVLYLARYQNRQKNAVAATVAWLVEQRKALFEVYYDAIRAGQHHPGGTAGAFGLLPGGDPELGLLTGGLVTGARHAEALSAALQRFHTMAFCAGDVAFGSLLAAAAVDGAASVQRVEEGDLVGLYDSVLSSLSHPWPRSAVMFNATPEPRLEGIDAYLWPEIFYRRALGIESSADEAQLRALHDRGVERIFTCGVPFSRQRAIARLGFQVEDLQLLEPGDDYALLTARMAARWEGRRRGWIAGDPVVASYWLPTACRERRAVIFGTPQSRVLELVRGGLRSSLEPAVLGPQYDDTDLFTFSELGRSMQVVEPGRPPLPVLAAHPPRWSSMGEDPTAEDPDDEELLEYARQGRVLVSLVFWTGMIGEIETLYALMDLLAMSGLKAGLVLTARSLAYRPSPLDLLAVPRAQGGVFPGVEVLLGSCGTGAAIESLLAPGQLAAHLAAAREELERIGVPPRWWPAGWWATMDAPLLPLPRWRRPPPVRWTGVAPYVLQVRFHGRDGQVRDPTELAGRAAAAPGWSERMQARVRDSRFGGFFSEYRPYESYGPGPLAPELAAVVKEAGFSYMLSKSGFGRRPRLVHRDGDFVALNYTAGQWGGWSPFETVTDVADLRRAERYLLARRRPGWLLATLDSCRWAFSGELWQSAPRLAAIARFAAEGGASGRLVNVPPRVVARYARLLSSSPWTGRRRSRGSVSS